MPIYLEAPTYKPGGPDGKGWNRLSLNAHMGTSLPQCALKPTRYETLWISQRNTVHSKWADGYGTCVGQGACDSCPVLAAKRLTASAFTEKVMVRILERDGRADEAHLMNRPEDGWGSSSYRWNWADLLRLDGWTIGSRKERDEHSAFFWLTKVNPEAHDGIPSPCPHEYINWRHCGECRRRREE